MSISLLLSAVVEQKLCRGLGISKFGMTSDIHLVGNTDMIIFPISDTCTIPAILRRYNCAFKGHLSTDLV
jgi:hypothetical protein